MLERAPGAVSVLGRLEAFDGHWSSYRRGFVRELAEGDEVSVAGGRIHEMDVTEITAQV